MLALAHTKLVNRFGSLYDQVMNPAEKTTDDGTASEVSTKFLGRILSTQYKSVFASLFSLWVVGHMRSWG